MGCIMGKLKKLFLYIRILPKLGFRNVLRVFFYRARVSLGLYPKRYRECIPEGGAFSSASFPGSGNEFHVNIFGFFKVDLGSNAEWHVNPLAPSQCADSSLSWPKSISSLRGGDVKDYWELSRFYWVPQLSYLASNGDCGSLQKLDNLLRDWAKNNKPYYGVMWSCGQEAAIRLMNIALGACILRNHSDPAPFMRWLIHCHVSRILPTIAYSIAQDNNHGSAEAAALFVAGSWLNHERAKTIGRYWLEDRVKVLIQPDGSPCQYSVTYHRANIETFCFAELWRREMGEPPFSDIFAERVLAGARWLYCFTNKNSGDAPNFGANDGSHLFNLTGYEYRDFRPTVNLAAILFGSELAFPLDKETKAKCDVFGLAVPSCVWPQPSSEVFPFGGNSVLMSAGGKAFFRYPAFRFRPSQCDLLHLDFWKCDINILRDAGTYRYNAGGSVVDYFSGLAGHNTIQFDSIDSMPRLSRFLFGAWPKVRNLRPLKESNGVVSAAAGYRDWKGAAHHRTISLSGEELMVIDAIYGFKKSAILRWRLAPGHWCWEDDWLVGHECRLRVLASQPIVRIEIVEGWESRYYSQKTPIPVLEVEVAEAGTLTTELRF